jgi:hypothetical protein
MGGGTMGTGMGGGVPMGSNGGGNNNVDMTSSSIERNCANILANPSGYSASVVARCHR